MNDMDAFKELEVRMPELGLATLEELKTISFYSEAAAVFGTHLVKKSKNNPALAEQSKVWLADSQRAMETHLFTESERGRRIDKKEQSKGNRFRAPVNEGAVQPKWKQQGFDSKTDMETAQILADHPGDVKEVIAEAKKEKDVPSKGAVKQKVRAKKMEERAKKAEAAAARNAAEDDKKTDIKNPKIVKEYLDATATFKEVLKRAIVGAKNERFDPAAWNFVYNRHTQIKEMMEELEGLI